jgi:hypothetical protein
MTEADLPQVVAAWNSVLVHDQVTAERLRQAVRGFAERPQTCVLVELVI